MPGFDQSARESFTRDLKAEARRLGFDACGAARARRLNEEARHLEEWLSHGLHAGMHWMEDYFEKRVDPRRLVDGAKSVISVLHNYYQPVKRTARAAKISQYAWGDDYHLVMKEKLFELYAWLDERAGGISGRAFVDSAPVLDKVWARESGLGWVGKHTNLISRSLGSFFFIGELIVDVPLAYDSPVQDFCGSCTRCLDACPTGAIFRPYAVDSNRCISYWTIEHRGDEFPDEIRSQLDGWVFGCDICQDVCPWNKFAKPAREARYAPRAGMLENSPEDWEELDLAAFRERFRRSALKRPKFDGLRRNLRAVRETPAHSEPAPTR